MNSSAKLEELKNIDLAHARDAFAGMLANYASFKGCKAILVYDAYATQGPAAIEELAGLQVVFTAEGETADSYIEKTAYELLGEKKQVFVVTGDKNEQFMALGMGAYRLTAGELLSDYKRVDKEIKARVIAGKPLTGRQEVADRLSQDVLYKLEQLRFKR